MPVYTEQSTVYSVHCTLHSVLYPCTLQSAMFNILITPSFIRLRVHLNSTQHTAIISTHISTILFAIYFLNIIFTFYYTHQQNLNKTILYIYHSSSCSQFSHTPYHTSVHLYTILPTKLSTEFPDKLPTMFPTKLLIIFIIKIL